MAEKSAKKKTKKAAKAETGVLGNLSASRPTRLGGDRRGTTAPRSSQPASKPKARSASKPAASKSPKPKVRRTPASASASAPPAGWQTPDQDGRKGSGDLVGTAVQAAGEIAQLGIAVGGQILKRATSRIPRP
jgi:hypothetical protein